ncbi:hypothetical protein [Streptomyces capoamus]|uniref:hypothetical protein n=1 Tax=Streptomyces capoamus TaxID=68183 RepID=UPI0034D7534F
MTCPKDLQRARGGQVVACLSACPAFTTDQTCRTGTCAARPQCLPSPRVRCRRTGPLGSARRLEGPARRRGRRTVCEQPTARLRRVRT